MPEGRPNWLETLAGILIPPACREEVLGDLHERYRSPGQYLGDLLSTAPFLILSRIRRNADAQVLVMEALLVYGSFLAGEWYHDPALMAAKSAMARLVCAATLTFAYTLVDEAFSQPHARFAWRGYGFRLALFWILLFTLGLGSITVLYGFWTSMVLVSGLRMLLQFAAPPQSTPGPAVAADQSSANAKAFNTGIGRQSATALLILAVIAVLLAVFRAAPRAAIYLAVVVVTWAAGLRYLNHR